MEHVDYLQTVCRMLTRLGLRNITPFPFRWLKVFHVSLESERRQQTLAKEAVGDNITAEMVPFTFPADGAEISTGSSIRLCT